MTTLSNDTVWYFSYGSNLDPDPDGGLDAEVYVVPTPKLYRAPSEKYLRHIIKGLRSFGYPESVLEEVRATAASEPLEANADPGGGDFR